MKTQLFEWENCVGKTISQIENQMVHNDSYGGLFEYMIILFTDDTFICGYSSKDKYGDEEIHIYTDEEYKICNDLPFDDLLSSKQELKTAKRQVKETIKYKKQQTVAIAKLHKKGLCSDLKITNADRKKYYRKTLTLGDDIVFKRPLKRLPNLQNRKIGRK